jgi:hypothetical protein
VNLGGAESKVDENRKAGWQKLLDGTQYQIPEYYSALLRSLGQFEGNAKVHVVFDPKDKWRIDYKFFRDDREVLSLRGHDQSAYAAKGNDLYFAEYSSASMGCTVVAYDLTTGKEQWRTKLHQAQPLGHSAYRNLVSVRISTKGEGGEAAGGAAIVITGKESYCDYVEVLDRKTGESLALKNYRVGFGRPSGGGGGFGGEARTKKSDRNEGGKR